MMHGETSLTSEANARKKFAAQIAQAGAAGREIGEQLFSFSSLLDQNSQVERAMTDLSRTPEAKAKLTDELLKDSNANDLTKQILRDLSGRRWSHVEHISDAVEDIAIDCILAAADAAQVTEQVAIELMQIYSAILNLAAVRQHLSNPYASEETRVAFLHRLLDDQHLNELTVILAEHATRELRQRRFTSTILWLVVKVSEHLGESVVTVTAAVALSSEQIERITNIYSEKLNRAVHVNMVVDPRVMGGMRVQAGSEVTDNTVVAQLENLKRMVA